MNSLGKCSNTFPVGYDENKINITCYPQDNNMLEGVYMNHCIALVSDNFSFTDDMVEIDKTNADLFIDARADIEGTAEATAKFKTTRKKIITDAGVV